MKPEDVFEGDELQIRAGLNGRNSKPVPVLIVSKRKGNADGGYVFETYPSVGSGFGVCAAWLEPRGKE